MADCSNSCRHFHPYHGELSILGPCIHPLTDTILYKHPEHASVYIVTEQTIANSHGLCSRVLKQWFPLVSP